MKKKSAPRTKKRLTRPAAKPDWRDATISRARALIKEADDSIVEEAKWKKPSNPAGVPTWSRAGIVCTGERYKTHVKFTFARGAALPDPAKQFNASLEAGTRRAIDLQEGDALNEKAFKALIRAAVALNVAKKK